MTISTKPEEQKKEITELIGDVYGIDLGTTYSAVAWMNKLGQAEVLRNSGGQSTTPSVVYFETEDNIVVGEIAKSCGSDNPDNVVSLIKRDMGSSDALVRRFFAKDYTPPMISSSILRHLAMDAEKLGKTMKNVVITVPAYFDIKAREATRAAGEMAGLNVLDLLDEPVAAALQYCDIQGVEEERNIIVYDLGGGTFDITIVRLTPNSVEVVCTDGDHQLGGADWDEVTENLLANQAREHDKSGVDVMDDSCTKYEIKLLSEDLKKTITAMPKASKIIHHEGQHIKVVLTREEFNNATADLLQRTENTTASMIEMAASKGIKTFHDFLLVGGSSWMPQVSDMVKRVFAPTLNVTPVMFDPDQAVAKGAAIYAQNRAIIKLVNYIKGGKGGEDPIEPPINTPGGHTLPTSIDDIKLPHGARDIKTVSSKSYGIHVLDRCGKDIVRNLILKQTPLPFSESITLPVSQDNERVAMINIHFSNKMDEFTSLETTELLGRAEIALDPPLNRGDKVQINLNFEIDGTVKLYAKDLKHGKDTNAEFKGQGAVSQEEFNAAIDANKNVSDDVK